MNHFDHLFAIAISDLRLFLWRAINSNRYFPMDPPALCGKALAMYRELSKRAVQTCPYSKVIRLIRGSGHLADCMRLLPVIS